MTQKYVKQNTVQLSRHVNSELCSRICGLQNNWGTVADAFRAPPPKKKWVALIAWFASYNLNKKKKSLIYFLIGEKIFFNAF